MAKNDIHSSFKTFKNHYRLAVTNDDTFEEVITFRLSRFSVYMVSSTVFVLLVGFTVALLVLTPLKYYIPGYGKRENRGEMQALKIRTDSLENVIQYKQKYLDDLKKTLNGSNSMQRDTTAIKVPKTEISHD
ncbi:MAG: hypothetical protein ABJA79_11515 [Parafilimonas sp.]